MERERRAPLLRIWLGVKGDRTLVTGSIDESLLSKQSTAAWCLTLVREAPREEFARTLRGPGLFASDDSSTLAHAVGGKARDSRPGVVRLPGSPWC